MKSSSFWPDCTCRGEKKKVAFAESMAAYSVPCMRIWMHEAKRWLSSHIREVLEVASILSMCKMLLVRGYPPLSF